MKTKLFVFCVQDLGVSQEDPANVFDVEEKLGEG
jgi:hypothetical protein